MNESKCFNSKLYIVTWILIFQKNKLGRWKWLVKNIQIGKIKKKKLFLKFHKKMFVKICIQSIGRKLPMKRQEIKDDELKRGKKKNFAKS